MRRPWLAQRIDIGHQVAAFAPRMNETSDAGLLHRIPADHGGGRLVRFPPPALPPNSALAEYLIVELVLALKQRLHPRQEHSRLGALNHAMVVGAGDGH